jgi:hypothetical protein
MSVKGYTENELVQNRAAVLLFGAREEERRAWAEEAARNFEVEGPLRTATSVEALKTALQSPRGVVFVPDVIGLGREGQALLLNALHQEERPKLVIALAGSADAAVQAGALRDDLHYRLQLGRLDLAPNELREAIRARRQKKAAQLAALTAAAATKRPERAPAKSSGATGKPVRSSSRAQRTAPKAAPKKVAKKK